MFWLNCAKDRNSGDATCSLAFLALSHFFWRWYAEMLLSIVLSFSTNDSPAIAPESLGAHYLFPGNGERNSGHFLFFPRNQQQLLSPEAVSVPLVMRYSSSLPTIMTNAFGQVPRLRYIGLVIFSVIVICRKFIYPLRQFIPTSFCLFHDDIPTCGPDFKTVVPWNDQRDYCYGEYDIARWYPLAFRQH